MISVGILCLTNDLDKKHLVIVRDKMGEQNNDKRLTYREKENFRALLETDKIDGIEDRLKIVDTFLETEGHVTLEELQDLLKKRGYDFDPDFVMQCMNRMVDLGFAQRKKFEGQPIRYEHRHLGRHHDHLICTKCGRIEEFEDPEIEELQRKVSARHGFQILQHKMEIYGLCSECLIKRKPIMPLALAKTGETVVIKDIQGGAGAKGRLAAMGLRPGQVLEVVSNNGEGRVIIGRECSRIALGRGLANKILVSPDQKEALPECKELNDQ